MWNVTACLCFKDSASYLGEWLAFHHAVGVEHFYLYDNNSTDDYRPVVEPWIKAGKATLQIWPGEKQQSAIYQDCIDRRKREAKWIAFIDDDEFLWPVVDPDLKTAMHRYDAYAGVAVCWFLYGSSHHETRPTGLVVENFTWRTWPPLSSIVKCVVCPERVLGPQQISHVFNCVPGWTVVDEQQRPISQPDTKTHSGEFLRLNHYVTKSMEELRARRARPRADSGAVSEHSIAQWEQWAREWNQVEDREVLKFLPATKALLHRYAPKRKRRWFFFR